MRKGRFELKRVYSEKKSAYSFCWSLLYMFKVTCNHCVHWNGKWLLHISLIGFLLIIRVVTAGLHWNRRSDYHDPWSVWSQRWLNANMLINSLDLVIHVNVPEETGQRVTQEKYNTQTRLLINLDHWIVPFVLMKVRSKHYTGQHSCKHLVYLWNM